MKLFKKINHILSSLFLTTLVFYSTSCAVKVETSSSRSVSSTTSEKSSPVDSGSPGDSSGGGGGGGTADTTAPTVSGVVVTNADGFYKAGAAITVQVTFSENVIVNTTGGTPYIILELGATDRNAAYTGGTGTTVLTFSHTLVSGDLNADLDYTSTGALSANSGTIKDAAGNDANLTLVAVGAAGSISDNQEIYVDTVNPTAPSVRDRADDQNYASGDQDHDNDTSVNFTWSGASDANSGLATANTYTYFIYDEGTSACVNNGSNSANAVSSASTTNSYVTYVGALTKTYKTQVQVFDKAGNSSFSNCSDGITIENTAPTAPTVIERADDQTYASGDQDTDNDTSVNFVWSGASDAGSGLAAANTYTYFIYDEAVSACVNNGSNSANAASTGSTTNSYFTYTATANKTYKGQVQVYDEAGNSSFSTCSDGIIAESDKTFSLTFPVAGKRVGWTTKISGACSQNGATLEVTSGTATGSGTCTSGTYNVFLDMGALALGNNTLTVRLLDTAGLRTPTSSNLTVVVNKVSSACDTLSSRDNLIADSYAGGTGTISDPYILCTADQLSDVRSSASAVYELHADIDFLNTDTNGDGVTNGSDTSTYRSAGSGWSPIYILNQAIRFNGNHFTIYNLFIDRAATNNVGLFSSTAGGFLLYNLNIEGATIVGNQNVGVVLGTLSGIADNVKVSNATVSCSNICGGIAGAYGGRFGVITNSGFSGGTIAATTIRAGGIVGYSTSLVPSYVSNSYFIGTVSGSTRIGGIAGEVDSMVVTNSFVAGNVNGTGGTIGGIIGSNVANNQVVGSFVTAAINNTGNNAAVGTISPTAPSVVLNTYWYSGSTCKYNAGANNCTALHHTNTGATLAHFYSSANAPLSSWDFTGVTTDGVSNIWKENAAAYPNLWFENDVTHTPPWTGSGTSSDPYDIGTAADLNLISENPRYSGAFFDINNSIDLTTLGATPYRPIAKRSAFYGTINGNGNTISHLTLNDVNAIGLGFVSVLGGKGSITDLNLTDVNISGKMHVGGALGFLSSNSTLTDISVTGTVTGSGDNVGGVLGYCYSGTFTRNTSNVTVTGANNVGGVLGTGSSVGVNYLSSFGNVTGVSSVGGIVGYGSVQLGFSYSESASVSGTTKVGGLIGTGTGTGQSVINSYSAVTNVTGTSEVGGIVGYSDSGHKILRSYASSSVTGTAGSVGGIIGYGTSTSLGVQYSFFSGDVSGSDAADSIGPIVGTDSGMTGSAGNYAYDTGSASACTNNGAGNCNTSLYTATPLVSNFYVKTHSVYTQPGFNWSIQDIASWTNQAWKINPGVSLPILGWQ